MKCLCVALFLASLSAWLSCSQSQYTCDKFSACSCEGSNFSNINVADILGKQVKNPIPDPNKPNKYEYLLNFCNGRKCEHDSGAGGGEHAVACQRQIDGQQNVSTKLGDVGQHTWQVFDNNTFTVLFAGGDTPNDGGTRSAMLYVYVVAKADPSVPINTVNYVEERKSGDNNIDHVYVFTIYITASEADKGNGGSIAGAIGLSLIFIALAGLIAYFIIGGILMFAVKGARGVEVIPNYTFWKALPIYIKDGFLFTISPCMKLAGKEKSGYQSL